jgi:hypothetical protein
MGNAMFPPYQVETGQLPRKWSKEMNPAGPFYLHSVKEQVEQDIQGQEHKNPAPGSGKTRQRPAKDQAAEQRCMNYCVLSQIKRINPCLYHEQDPLDDPRDIGYYAPDRDPFEIRRPQQGFCADRLNAKVYKCIRHDVISTRLDYTVPEDRLEQGVERV